MGELNLGLLQRSGRHSWGVLVLSALLVPIFVESASGHQGHWAVGPDYWPKVVVPGAARLWSVCMLVAIVAWSAGAGPHDPRTGRRIGGGALAGLLGVSLAGMAAMPGWVWLLRLGAAPGATLAAVAGLAMLGPLCGGVVSGAAGGWAGESAGVSAGALAGGLVVWAVWGHFG